MNEEQYQELLQRVEKIEDKLIYERTDHDFIEFIREIAIPDVDNSTVTTQSIGIAATPTSITAPKNPDFYLRLTFRGKTYNIPAHNLP